MSSDETFFATIVLIVLSIFWLGSCDLMASKTGFHYVKRPVMQWGHYTPAHPYGSWHYIRTTYNIR